MADSDTRRSVSKEAWGAIGIIVAALITGGVTLLVRVPPTGPGQSATNSPAPSTGTTAPTSEGTRGATTIAAMVGRWRGTARDENGKTFTITLTITKGCAVHQLCGTIGVSHVPCYGEISLVRVVGRDVEFNVDNFDERSDPEVCKPGPGEHFELTSEGRLAYRTDYHPLARGALDRT
ncbi:hypothetical protein [Streptomyces sp. NPDC001221]